MSVRKIMLSDQATSKQSHQKQFEMLENRTLMSVSLFPNLVNGKPLAHTTLPAPQGFLVPASNPVLPSGTDVFSPQGLTGSALAGTPAIATSSLTAGPNDTLILTGAAFTNDAKADYADSSFMVYGQTTATNGTLAAATLQVTSLDGMLATIPASEPNQSMYLIWPKNGTGYGAPVAVNRTDAQWMNPGTAAPLSTVSVYGQNLDNGSGQSWVYLQPATGKGQWAAVTSANPYRVQFTMPAGLTPGSNYQVWVYNGHGGEYGWSSPLSVTVGSPQTWTGVVNVRNYGATGNGVTNDGPAILSAIAALTPNETLYFPTGTYVVDGQQIVLPSNTRVMGDSQAQSVIEFEGAVPDTAFGPFDIGVYDFQNAQNIDFESIGLTYSGPDERYTSCAVVRERSATDMTFNNVNITSNSIGSIDWENSCKLQLTNSTISGKSTFVNGSWDVTMNNDLFLQSYDSYGQMAVTFDDATNLSVTNCTTENLYTYELSQNPSTPYDSNAFGEGRFMFFDQMTANAYIGSNQSIDLGEDAAPVDNNSGEQFGSEGMQNVVNGSVVSATTNTFTLTGYLSQNVMGLTDIVTSGSGLAQQSTIIGAKYNPTSNTTTFTTSLPFAVIPSAGSQIAVDQIPTYLVFYQNTLNHTTGQYAGADQASVGFQFFGGAAGVVIDDNTVNNTRSGVRLWSSDSTLPISNAEVMNNTINHVQTGVQLLPTSTTSANIYAVTVRSNVISGGSTTYAAASGIDLDPFGQPVITALSVIEHNTVSSFPVGINASDDPSTLAYQNSLNLGSATIAAVAAIRYGTTPSSLVSAGNMATTFQNPIKRGLTPLSVNVSPIMVVNTPVPLPVTPAAPTSAAPSLAGLQLIVEQLFGQPSVLA